PGRNEVMQLIACAERKPLRHRLNALAVARTDQSRHVERAHLSPCFVTQPIQKRLEPTSEHAHSAGRRAAVGARGRSAARHPPTRHAPRPAAVGVGALDAVDLLRARWPDHAAALREKLALTDDELADWRDAVARIVVNLDPATGIYEQFAGF